MAEQGTRRAGRANSQRRPGLQSKGNPQQPVNGTDFARERASPGPPVSALLPALSPATQASRAIPCPEVTEPVCRLPLPTLFYRPEAVHLGDLLRIWVRAGANRRSPQLDFQGPARRPWTQRELLCSWRQSTKTHSPREVIPGIRSLMQKRQLFPGFGRASQALFVLPR